MADRLALFPLGTVLFPGATLPLHVFEERYRTLVGDLLFAEEPRSFGVIAIREGHEVGADAVRALYDVGCVAELTHVRRFPDGRYALLAVGRRRFRVVDVDRSYDYLRADVELLDEELGDESMLETGIPTVLAACRNYEQLIEPRQPAAELPDDPTLLSYAIAARLAVGLPQRQMLLESVDTARRIHAACQLLSREITLMRNLGSVAAVPPLFPPHSRN